MPVTTQENSERAQQLPDNSSYSEGDTRKAWERFVSSEKDGDGIPAKVRDEILASWRRSREFGVDAGSQASRKVIDDTQLFQRRERNIALRKAASAAFKRLEPHLKEARTILILADSHGVIIDAIGDENVLDEGQEIHLELGGDWSERSIGTNGIGTALRTGKPSYVHASEHFAEGVQAWTCAGAPIFDPLTQNVIGVVDLSGPPQIFRQHNVALVLAAAREIEIALAEQKQIERTELLEAFLMSDYGRAHDGVVLVDESGSVLFRRGLDDDPLRQSKELLIGHKLLPKLEGLSDQDIPKLLPLNVEAEGIERLKLEGVFRGAALFLKGKGEAQRQVRASCIIRPRINVAESEIEIIGSSPKMADAISLAERAALANVSVLIHGETGVGKELFARLIHSRLPDENAPYVPVNCAAISSDLIGAELFGYSEGAFTGAVRGGRAGRFEQANNGMLCLDEIGDMPIELQPYLLRALEQRAIYRMGDNKRRPVDVRLVSMTNRDLRQEIEKGNFRRDLFYRIGVMTIEVPPLRERGNDIVALLDHFSQKYAEETGRTPMTFTNRAMELLLQYQWPGNVRELRNVVQRFYLIKLDSFVTERDLPPEIHDEFEGGAEDSLEHILGGHSGDLESIEASAIRRAIASENGNLTKVAQVLGISRPTLYRKIKRYHIRKV
ncbi:sigma-54-dependent Fis family transcriptional regulator [Phaeobacter gallaeciensis]|uniref:Nif-specific regulatory protein n=1 Tax=Phaeobacter gallaeciensis TaxID=60890 RepID=A0AAC9Z9R3_9RHOB|nr:sigma-54-dependent Fis family transcriptional regulator [Phaeobacter gallaeciensis]AHD09181.1 Transcriptional activator of acetoin/glycerol metabolism [Phaeobacter gallaeciensis DSM 26640]ATE92444.1 Transcriptional activator of acetoin/glycerol metabolism [Phaeobacter gallaeciensis]ATE97734.1 Transcriptional activator of acetoin/glycerol metabolism [Phaeobacter gallaeciensis]ATF01109.1 Transcriptional activator of acetoin/glycerol metabolism [Phaeobacter gallaeciensis]ATF05489.1 Transcripti